MKAAAEDTMQAALTANDKRVRLVHDMWIKAPPGFEPSPGSGPAWFASRGKVRHVNAGTPEPPRDLDFMRAAVRQIHRARLGMEALLWLLFAVLPFYADAHAPDHDFQGDNDFYLPIVQDRFEVTNEGTPIPRR